MPWGRKIKAGKCFAAAYYGDTGIMYGAVYIGARGRSGMDETKKKFLGLVYLIIGAISLLSGLSSTAEV